MINTITVTNQDEAVKSSACANQLACFGLSASLAKRTANEQAARMHALAKAMITHAKSTQDDDVTVAPAGPNLLHTLAGSVLQMPTSLLSMLLRSTVLKSAAGALTLSEILTKVMAAEMDTASQTTGTQYSEILMLTKATDSTSCWAQLRMLTEHRGVSTDVTNQFWDAFSNMFQAGAPVSSDNCNGWSEAWDPSQQVPFFQKATFSYNSTVSQYHPHIPIGELWAQLCASTPDISCMIAKGNAILAEIAENVANENAKVGRTVGAIFGIAALVVICVAFAMCRLSHKSQTGSCLPESIRKCFDRNGYENLDGDAEAGCKPKSWFPCGK